MGLIGAVALAAVGLLLWSARAFRTRPFSGLAGWAAATSRWDRLPVPLALAAILLYRNRLRRENLHDTESRATRSGLVAPTRRHLTARTADGA